MKRSKFSLSNYKLLSCNIGELVPCGIQEVLPGDSFQHSTSVLIRCSPLVAPVMHPLHARVHHFFVPTRLVWEDWESFITGGSDGMDAAVMPTITFGGGTGAAVGSLADYLGVAPLVNNVEVSALPFRAYALIFNEYFRDQDLITPLTIDLTSGADTTTNTALQYVSWEKDYFTSSRPWTQKGPEVTIPLTGNAPVKGIGVVDGNFTNSNVNVIEAGTGATTFPFAKEGWSSDTNEQHYIEGTAATSGQPNIFADLSSVTAASVNDLRLALALQRYEEARARYGSRYTEYLAYLGVRSSDARLQRPEYLGGGKQTIQFSEVLQTAPAFVPSDDEQVGDVGELKGHGIGALRSNRYRRFFEEHGFVISLLSLRPRSMYVQGLKRMWLRRTKEDFWQKELQHIGQQEIDRKEIWAASASATPFGYQDRYDEYRRTESSVAGEFRTTLLNYWHMARIFGSEPSLNSDFINLTPDQVDRIFAVPSTTQNTLWCMCNHSLQARRMVAAQGTSFIF